MADIKISQINGNPVVDAELTKRVDNIVETTIPSINRSIEGNAESIIKCKNDLNEKIDDIKSTLNTITGGTSDNDILDTFKEVSSVLGTKADKEDVYSKNDINNLLNDKIASDSVYTKENIDEKVNELTTNIEAKASSEELTALKEKVAEISGSDEAYDTITELKGLVDQKADEAIVNENLAKKVNITDFETFKTENASELTEKVSTSDMENALKTKIELDDFNALKKEVEGQHYEVEFTIGSGSTAGFSAITPKYGTIDSDKVSKKGNRKILFVDGVVSKKGNQRFNGQGDFTYTPVLNSGYRVVRTKIDGAYDSLEVGPTTDKDGVVKLEDGQYCIKNIHSDISVELILSNADPYTVTFPAEVLEKCKIVIYTDNNFTNDEVFCDYTEPFSLISNGFCFKIIPNDGYSYMLTAKNISGEFNKLNPEAKDKYPADCFNITKIASDLTVTPVFTKIEKHLADYSIVDAYTKDETDTKLSEIKESIPTGAYLYRGSVADLTALKAVENPKVGDVYNVESSGVFRKNVNYAWNGTDWDSLGSSVDVDLDNYYKKSEVYSTSEIDVKLDAKQDNLPAVPDTIGTYVLKATRTADGVTYSWVSETTSE